jgi:hypothetical protein
MQPWALGRLAEILRRDGLESREHGRRCSLHRAAIEFAAETPRGRPKGAKNRRPRRRSTFISDSPSSGMTMRTRRAAKPDRPAPQEIAHHDPIGVTLTDRDLVNANHPVKASRPLLFLSSISDAKSKPSPKSNSLRNAQLSWAFIP